MSEYYAVQRSTDHLAHYGVLGMRWGVRKNPQKQFYKSMKREMKSSLHENKVAHKTVSSGAKNIGKSLPRSMVRDYIKSRDRMEKAFSAREDHENRPYGAYKKTHKPMTKQQQEKFLRTSRKLMQDEDAAYEAHQKFMDNARSELLGKYSGKKIRMDSHNTRMKRDADYVLKAAFASQMPDRNPVKLNKKQKALEKKWKEANQKWKDAPAGKLKQQLGEDNMKAADAFFKSMPEKQWKKYHDRYLY